MTPCFLADRTVLHIKSVPADCSMVDLPCPDIASHTFSAKWTPVNDAFLCHNAILNRQFVPTDCSMVYLPCCLVTGHMPIAGGTNVVILFRTGASFPDSEKVTACAAVIYLACSYGTAYRLIAMRAHVLENLALGHGFCCLSWPHRPRPFVAVVLLAMYLCRPLCGHFCSVLLSALFWLRLCFLPLGALLFPLPFSFRDGIPDIGDGACLFFFRCPSRHFRLRCRYPLYRFADASPGNGALPAVATDLVTIQERCCASQDSKAHAACFTLQTLHLHQPHALLEQSRHTLPPLRARFQAPPENFFSSLRVLQPLHTCVCSHVLQIR